MGLGWEGVEGSVGGGGWGGRLSFLLLVGAFAERLVIEPKCGRRSRAQKTHLEKVSPSRLDFLLPCLLSRSHSLLSPH